MKINNNNNNNKNQLLVVTNQIKWTKHPMLENLRAKSKFLVHFANDDLILKMLNIPHASPYLTHAFIRLLSRYPGIVSKFAESTKDPLCYEGQEVSHTLTGSNKPNSATPRLDSQISSISINIPKISPNPNISSPTIADIKKPQYPYPSYEAVQDVFYHIITKLLSSFEGAILNQLAIGVLILIIPDAILILATYLSPEEYHDFITLISIIFCIFNLYDDNSFNKKHGARGLTSIFDDQSIINYINWNHRTKQENQLRSTGLGMSEDLTYASILHIDQIAFRQVHLHNQPVDFNDPFSASNQGIVYLLYISLYFYYIFIPSLVKRGFIIDILNDTLTTPDGIVYNIDLSIFNVIFKFRTMIKADNHSVFILSSNNFQRVMDKLRDMLLDVPSTYIQTSVFFGRAISKYTAKQSQILKSKRLQNDWAKLQKKKK